MIHYALNTLEACKYLLRGREAPSRQNVRGFRALDFLPIDMRPMCVHKARNVHIWSFRGSGTVNTSQGRECSRKRVRVKVGAELVITGRDYRIRVHVIELF